MAAKGERALFSIIHFAGEVEYSGHMLLDKNRDNLAADIVQLLQHSGMVFVQDMYHGETSPSGECRPRAGSYVRTLRGTEPPVVAKVTNTANKKAPTLGTQFRTSLSTLIEQMGACFPHFVRCIKPNLEQLRNSFNLNFVTMQLRYTGVMEATRIRQEGYSWRPLYADFVRRYKILHFAPSKLHRVQDGRASAVKILQVGVYALV